MLFRYIPNITKALFSVIQKMEVKSTAAAVSSSSSSNSSDVVVSKAGNGASALPTVHQSDILKVLLEVSRKSLTEAALAEHLQRAVDKYESDTVMQNALDRAANDATGGGAAAKRRKLFITPDFSLWDYPLPPETQAADAVSQVGASPGFSGVPVRQGSLQSTISYSSAVVDLTDGLDEELFRAGSQTSQQASSSQQRGTMPSPAAGRKRSFLSTISQQSSAAASSSRSSSSSSKSGASGGGGAAAGGAGTNRQWVRLSLVPTSGGASSAAGSTGADGALVTPAAVTAYLLVSI